MCLSKNQASGYKEVAKIVKVYILLSDTGTHLSRLIKCYTKEPYNHASISFSPNLDILYSFGRKTPNNPLYGGFVKENVYFGTYRKFPETTCALYEIEITEKQKEDMERIIQVFEKNEAFFRYHLIGLFGVVLNEPINSESAYFCSKFVATIFKKAGVYLWEKEPSLLTPTDLSRSEKLKLIYEGRLYEYPPIKNNPLIHNPVDFRLSLKEDFLYPTKRIIYSTFYRNPEYSFRKEFLDTDFLTKISKKFNL